jgi:membrane-bound lytic murein transglycosylase D
MTEELDSTTFKQRLAILNAETPFKINYNPILHELIKKKLSYKRIYMERIMTLSDYYFPMFEPYLDKYDIPLEMKYLAVVESALDPQIKSRVGATGLWQFMYTTGKMYGLDVNSFVDERMDPVKATEAACQYLTTLHDMYGDWDLALAAYNSGPGNVNKAIRRSGGYTNYWNIRPYLPRETADYVPQFHATMYLFKYAEEHGFRPRRTVFKSIETDTVHVREHINFDLVAAVTGMDKEDIAMLNPSYKLDVIPKSGENKSILRLPRKALSQFVSNEDEIYAFAKAELDKSEKPLPDMLEDNNRTVYRVESGDYLGKIARKYGVRVSQIQRWNNMRSTKLSIGQRLYLYPRDTPAKKKKKKEIPETYIVQDGDKLWQIAYRTGLTVDNLRSYNDLSELPLVEGQILNLKENNEDEADHSSTDDPNTTKL